MPEKTYQDLRDKFDGKVEELRESCDHPEVSDWQGEHWAPGHPTEFEVKVCETCRKTVARRTRCAECAKLIEEEKFEKGDGTKRPVDEIFCSECQKEWEEFVREHPFSEREEMVLVKKRLPDGELVEESEKLDKVTHYMRLHREFLKQASTRGPQYEE